jgi:hypothetical protein
LIEHGLKDYAAQKFRQRMNCFNVGCKNGGNLDAAQGGGGFAIVDLFDF